MQCKRLRGQLETNVFNVSPSEAKKTFFWACAVSQRSKKHFFGLVQSLRGQLETNVFNVSASEAKKMFFWEM